MVVMTELKSSTLSE